MALDREALLRSAQAPPRMEEVDVPELGGSVFVKVMSGSERDRFEEVHVDAKFRNFRARVAVATLCDAEGKALFSEADVAEVGRLPGPALGRIFDAARRINGLTKEDVDALEKNS